MLSRTSLILWIFTVSLMAVLALSAAAQESTYSPEIVEHPEITLLDSEGSGKLFQVGEHLVCVLEGAPEEMGYQHGRLLAKKIEHIMREGYMKNALWGKGYTREYVMEQSKRMEKHIPAEYIVEMQGLAKGMAAAGIEGLGYEEVLLGVTQAEILHFEPDSPPACSNFACWGPWTTDGRLLHGRNLDWDVRSGAQDDAVILIWRPKGGHPFMMMGWAGGIGSVSGMNSRGMTFGEMTLPSANASFDGMPLFIQMRHVLEHCDSLDQAITFLETIPRTSGWNFILGDGKVPDGRAFETDAKRCVVYKPMDPKETEETGHYALEHAVRRTNHPIGQEALLELAQWYGPRIGINVQTWDQLKLMMPMLKSQNSWQRYDWLGQRILAQPGAIDIREAIDILANGPVYCEVTLHAFVFDPKKQTAYVANAANNPPVTATRRPFTRIDLEEWFK